MPPFQSRLFQWISQSLPFRWGRRLRQYIDRWLQDIPKAVPHPWRAPSPSPVPPQTDRAKLPPWQRFLAQTPLNQLAPQTTALAQAIRDITPSRWRSLLEEAINYFLRRPKLSPRHQEYHNESGHWPPLPPPQDQITVVELEPEEPAPLHAWVDTQATFLGYAYSPLVNFLLWLDRLILRLEEWLIQLWRKFWHWLTTYRPA